MPRLFKRESEQKSLWQRIKDVALTDVSVLVQGMDENSLERLEELLLASDFGVSATLRLVDHVEELSRQAKVGTEQELLGAVEEEIRRILRADDVDYGLNLAAEAPIVMLVAGVNGVGKTTTIGKIAHRFKADGRDVLLAAGDTFRAGAIDQLREWAERVDVGFVGAQPGADPASVAFDAVDAANRRGADVVLIDTAGRLHTQRGLMDELGKIQRVLRRKVDGAPHEALLVLDATVGQNAVMQVRRFQQALDLSGLILAKLDSTAKGGIVVALKEEFGLPIKLVGTGEGVGDLAPFDPEAFAGEVLTA